MSIQRRSLISLRLPYPSSSSLSPAVPKNNDNSPVRGGLAGPQITHHHHHYRHRPTTTQHHHCLLRHLLMPRPTPRHHVYHRRSFS
ncbi:hypothetical protein E2C01_026358 [Portunus trituberculatus]|uniref:Uncharacterized protein n=1 Tax=Portunus trituberculatus TaxID=210409 RepID=A0A5B7EF75_PORTR|nr:hypothetical protein [Portunus trituberculatus]